MGAEHLAFLTSQAAYIEPRVYARPYASIQYPSLIPVDTQAPPFSGSITYFTMDGFGKAEFLGEGGANDFPMVETERNKFDVRIEAAGIGYKYNEFELGQAMMIGVSLTDDRAMIARRVAEEMIDQTVLYGQSDMGWDGLINSGIVNKSDAADGAGGSKFWQEKTPAEIIADVTAVLSGIHADSLQVEMADTLLMPVAARDYLASTQLSSGSDLSILQWIMMNNVYTAETGQPLMIRTVRQLDKIATNSHGRIIGYARDPEVLKFHLPMPLRFFPAQQVILDYIVPGAFRMGGLEIRRPFGIRYLDQIWDPDA